jgi:uncharacterized protein YdaU (DUF1376 family)
MAEISSFFHVDRDFWKRQRTSAGIAAPDRRAASDSISAASRTVNARRGLSARAVAVSAVSSSRRAVAAKSGIAEWRGFHFAGRRQACP